MLTTSLFAFCCSVLTSSLHAAPWWAPCHLDFAGSPVYLWIMISQPGDAQDQVLPSEAGYCEQGTFRMFFVANDELYYFRDASGFIRGAVYIEHCYWAGELFDR